MLSLRSICLLKVSSLKLSFKEDEVPYTLVTELKQMLLFNGNFFGQEEYVYFAGWVWVNKALKEHVLTIQYQGDGTWAFGICHVCDRCTDRTCDGNKHCGKRPERLQFVLQEKQTCDSQAVFKIVRGLARFSAITQWKGKIHGEKRQVSTISTVLTVEHANVPGQPDSGQLVLTTSAVMESGKELTFSCKLWVNSTSGSSPVFQCSKTVRISPELLQTGESGLLQTGEIPLHLTECQVAAKEAFPETVSKCELLDENLADGEDVDDEEWFDGEEETDDEAVTDGEEETEDEAMTDGEEETDEEAMTDSEEDTDDEAMNDGEEEADDQ
eukprot:GFUD01011860.1.p1 GENE.GFUD01011860.1~~GFUD01011860.1.p1  ORF type:complete len:327 (+),score=95.13 GFUD01011860.1:273-1253(+)